MMQPDAKFVGGRSDIKRLLAHYAAFIGAYVLYGYHVCPFLDDLTLVEISIPVVAAMGGHFVIHHAIERAIDRRPPDSQVTNLFVIGWLLFAALGAGVAAFNFHEYGFPLGSGGKVIVGFVAIGLYISLDLSLRRDLRLAMRMRAEGVAYPVNDRFLPYQTKFLLFSGVNVIVMAVIGMLVALKDLEWIRTADLDFQAMKLLLLVDAAVVLLILGGYIMLVVRQYSRKIAYSLAEENAALRAVRDGDLSSRVAVISNDEFGQLAQLTNGTIGQLAQSLEDIERNQTATIRSLVSLAAQRDSETGLHLKRTQIYVELLARQLQRANIYPELSNQRIDAIVKAAPLHDIGKVGIPDAVLQKPGKLTDDEFAIMRRHTTIGADALREAKETVGQSAFLDTAIEIAEHHHERWDGRGYPAQLAGDAIPLAARIMAVADVYDALRTARVYKPARSHADARAMIVEGAGRHFDPAIIGAFLAVEQHFVRVAYALQDRVESHALPAPEGEAHPATPAPHSFAPPEAAAVEHLRFAGARRS